MRQRTISPHLRTRMFAIAAVLVVAGDSWRTTAAGIFFLTWYALTDDEPSR